MSCKEISLNNNLVLEIKANHLQKLWTVNVNVNWLFGHYIRMGSLASMNLFFILWGPNGKKYKKTNLIFWIIILSYSLDKNSTPNVSNPQISTFWIKKISPKVLYELMKTINEFKE